MKTTRKALFIETLGALWNIKRKARTDPRHLFEKYNCEIIKATEDFLMVVPLDWECAVFFNSCECGGEGANWFIGDADDASHWNNYLADNNVFFLIFFAKKHPIFKRKAVIQYHVEDGRSTLWLQNDTRRHRVSNILKTLNISIEFIQKRAEWLLGRIWSKDYLFDGLKLVKCYINHGTIDIPAGITVIEKDAFSDCEKINRIIVEKQNPRFVDVDGILFDKIENRMVYYPAGKEAACYMIPAGVTSIGDFAFSGCESLTAINIPDSVTSIGDWAFFGCGSLTAINIPDSVTSIGNWAFFRCGSLTAINIPDSVTSIGNGAFFRCKSLAAINIPDSVTSIGNGAFFRCKSLAAIDIPDSVTSIGDGAFFGCESLMAIDIPDSVTSIGNGTFSRCESLTVIHIPDSVTSIGDCAFSKCKSLAAINIPNSVVSIGIFAFYGCKALRSLTFSRVLLRIWLKKTHKPNHFLRIARLMLLM